METVDDVSRTKSQLSGSRPVPETEENVLEVGGDIEKLTRGSESVHWSFQSCWALWE